MKTEDQKSNLDKNTKLVDFFVYFGPWKVHHQIDWALAREIKLLQGDNSCIRIFDCSHNGFFNCAIHREFKEKNPIIQNTVCRDCKITLEEYFSEFNRADKPAYFEKIKESLDEYSVDLLLNGVAESIVTDKFDGESMRIFRALIRSAKDLSITSAMTHFRISKDDIRKEKNKELINHFVKSILYEGIRILTNWKIRMPSSVVLFNGRIGVYSVPFFLAKFIGVPIYIHERGLYKSYSFFYNERPSAGKAKKSLMKNLNKYRPYFFNRISDMQLTESLNRKFSNLRKPANYPNFYKDNNNKKEQLDVDRSKYQYVITYIVSSDDEADTEIELEIGRAQRNAINNLLEYSKNNKNVLIIIKMHPNIYGVNNYPGMKEALEFYEVIEQKSHIQKNLLFLGKDSIYGPYEIIERSDIVLGLHSSLIEYSWFIGKKIVSHYETIMSNSTQYVIDFNDKEEFFKCLNHITSEHTNNKSEIALQKLKNKFTALILDTFAFDVDLGNIEIADDHFSPKYTINYLRTKGIKENSSQIREVADAIVKGEDINLRILDINLNL